MKQERKRKSMTNWDPNPYFVKEIKHSMITVIRDGKEITRNSSFFTPVGVMKNVGSQKGGNDIVEIMDTNLGAKEVVDQVKILKAGKM